MKIFPSFYVGLILAINLTASSPAFANTYLLDLNTNSLKDLGQVNAKAINDAGQVTGVYSAGGALHGFITGSDGAGITALPTLGGNFVEAIGINAAGRVAGTSLTVNGDTHAFITGPDGIGITDLGTLGGDYSEARGINSAGQVVGVSTTVTGDRHGFVTGPYGKGMKDLGAFEPMGINSAGQIIVYSYPQQHVFLGDSDRPDRIDLGPLHQQRTSVSYPLGAINATGEVIQNRFFLPPIGQGDVEFSSAIIAPGGIFVANGVFGAQLHALNDAGEAVGMHLVYHNTNTFFPEPSTVDSFPGFLAAGSGSLYDLNLIAIPKGVYLTDAFAINNAGQILAAGIVSEPETYALLLAGLGLIGFIAGRRSRQLEQ